ncbi:MAG: tRNA (guanosine(46)-N7)-methyltransferase TrmB [Clostridiales bacterium]|nr:tRNA (guanosine(46)-N7)-methyltransferase TrmB [Clostridiales bacterium]
MRQRKAKDLDRRLEECAELMIDNPEPDKWQEYFGRDANTFVEIGCGKGNFIIKKAMDNPECNFVAIEGQETVILRAMEKVLELREEGVPLDNLRFMCTFVNDMRDLFAPESLAGIYLNFSDPWPKARHAKRRLTHRNRLMNYGQVVKEGGFVEFKTDNDDLFEFTLEEIGETNYAIMEQTRNLHGSQYDSRLTMTEYEHKFYEQGKNINYVKIML